MRMIIRKKDIMPLVTTKQMLKEARSDGYAVGAFNAENLEMMQAVVAAAEKLQAPVIIQTTPSTVSYASTEEYASLAAVLAKKASVPVAVHLDHGSSFELASKAYHDGYSSIMIDGSQLSLENNIALTKRVAEMCRASNIPVEGELGKVGGKEDDTESDASVYTDVDEAVKFAAETGVDSLAVGVGTAHGVYKETPILNLKLISKLKAAVPVPLVLHGASGLSDEVVRECIRRGMCKVNFATELRIAYTRAVAEYLRENPETIDPKKYGAAGREAVQDLAEDKIRVCAGLL